jgi:hypothetical protein
LNSTAAEYTTSGKHCKQARQRLRGMIETQRRQRSGI